VKNYELRICRFCGWVGDRGLWDEFEGDYSACPLCLYSHDGLMLATRKATCLFGWRVAYLRYRATSGYGHAVDLDASSGPILH
jgi:hypothetical protein